MNRHGWLVAGIVAFSTITNANLRADDWVDIVGHKANLDAFVPAKTDWQVVSGVALDPKNPKRFGAPESTGEGTIIYNGVTGRTPNIITKEKYGDIELHMEFNVPKGSNSGVKFHGVYEIQIADSFNAKEVNASQLGGIYPRAEMLPTYHHIDKGFPPKSVPAKAPGEWQTLDVIFQAAKFDEAGKKISNVKIVKATVNGVVVHENVEVPYPTGDNWKRKEVAKGPLLLQGDHGPVALRNIRVRPWSSR